MRATSPTRSGRCTSPGRTLHLGLAPVGEDLTSSIAWTRALAEALADGGASVLLVDIATGRPTDPGIARGRARPRAARDGRHLRRGSQPRRRRSRLRPAAGAPGAHHAPDRAPDDVDVLLVALPQIVTRSAVNASRVLDQVLFVAEANLTSRVELMASLDALRVAGCGRRSCSSTAARTRRCDRSTPPARDASVHASTRCRSPACRDGGRSRRDCAVRYGCSRSPAHRRRADVRSPPARLRGPNPSRSRRPPGARAEPAPVPAPSRSTSRARAGACAPLAAPQRRRAVLPAPHGRRPRGRGA
jgi:hypothetical protein